MSDKKLQILKEIKNSINKRKNYLLNQLPIIHTINDGIIIRFFDDWSESEHDRIKYMEITDETTNKNDDIKTYYFFLPKGSIFDVRKHKYIETMICLEGKIQLHYDNKFKLLKSFSRFDVPENMKHYGIAIENTYLLVTSKI